MQVLVRITWILMLRCNIILEIILLPLSKVTFNDLKLLKYCQGYIPYALYEFLLVFSYSENFILREEL